MKKFLSQYNYVFYMAWLCFAGALYADINENIAGALYFATTAIFFLGISILVDEIRKMPNIKINMNGKTEIKYGKDNEH